MHQINTRTALLLAALLAAASSAVAAETNTPATADAKPAAKPMDLFANEIVAQGKGVKVTRAQLDAAPPAVPDTAERLIGVTGSIVPTKSVTASSSSALPIEISPVEVPPKRLTNVNR